MRWETIETNISACSRTLGVKKTSDRRLRTYYSYVRDWEYVFLLEYWYINLTQ